MPIVALSTGLAELFFRLTGSDRLSSIFLFGVLLAAFLLGSGPAYLAAALEFGVYMFLVDPRYQLTFGSADDFNVLMVFLAVAVVTGTLTGRVRDEAARAKARQRVSNALLDATQAFSATDDEAEIRRRVAERLSGAVRGEAVLRDGLRLVSAPERQLEPELLRPIMEAETRVRAGEAGTFAAGPWTVRGLSATGQHLGVAAWRQLTREPLGEEEQLGLDILIDTGAAAIARARLAQAKSEAEGRARTEDLRNALLSSISHDLRTPLASILASASSLRAYGDTFDAATRADLAATVQEEAERLDLFVANLLSMTRLEAGALSVQLAPFDVQEVADRVVERRNLSGTVRLNSAPQPPLLAQGDPQLFEQALGNVVENAMRYATGAAISLHCESDEVQVTVLDAGPGVPPGDEQRIFEKFYRGARPPQAPGTGLGLSIVRGLMRAMGGDASARNRPDGSTGLMVTLSLRRA